MEAWNFRGKVKSLLYEGRELERIELWAGSRVSDMKGWEMDA
jgi:hypothetical protein